MDAPEVVSQKLDRRTHLASGLISGFLAGLGWVLLPSPGEPFAYLRILPPMLVLYAVQELYRWERPLLSCDGVLRSPYQSLQPQEPWQPPGSASAEY